MQVHDLNFDRARETASDAFVRLAESLELAEAQLIEVGTNLAKEGKFAEVARLAPWRSRFLHLRTLADRLNEQFFSTFDDESDLDDANIAESRGRQDLRTRTRGPNKSMTVTLWDGRVVREASAAQSFAIVLGELGWEKVEALGIELSGIPLVSRERHHLYDVKKMVYQYVDGWYVMTNSSTDRKVQLLQDISEALGRTINVFTELD
ncbi:MAG: hypothetical protein VKP72_01880 [bacterium]|nr:hypothetical protein [bacterium]